VHVRVYAHACAHNYVFVTYETFSLLYNKNKTRSHLMLKPVFMGMQEALKDDLGNRQRTLLYTVRLQSFRIHKKNRNLNKITLLFLSLQHTSLLTLYAYWHELLSAHLERGCWNALDSIVTLCWMSEMVSKWRPLGLDFTSGNRK